jgi:hypothetical protein
LQSQGRSFTLKSAASAATACGFLTIDCFTSHQRLAGPGLPSAVPFRNGQLWKEQPWYDGVIIRSNLPMIRAV